MPAKILAIAAAALLIPCEALATGAGDLYLTWGYNRSVYSASDMHFTGADHDFTLERVRAHDRPETSGWKYLPPFEMLQPQYNIRIGYQFSDRIGVSFGMDHMKYVIHQNQRLTIRGTIEEQASARYAGSYNGQRIDVPRDFLRLEHSDGLNYFSVDVDVRSRAWRPLNGPVALRGLLGIGAGPVVPRTEAYLFGEGRNNPFRVAGFAGSAQLGWMVVFANSVYLRHDIKGGWITLPSVFTTGRPGDRAAHDFGFLESYLLLGAWLHLGA